MFKIGNDESNLKTVIEIQNPARNYSLWVQLNTRKSISYMYRTTFTISPYPFLSVISVYPSTC